MLSNGIFGVCMLGVLCCLLVCVCMICILESHVMYVCICVCMCVCMCVCTYVCVFVCAGATGEFPSAYVEIQPSGAPAPSG